jgi:hypothetical protein
MATGTPASAQQLAQQAAQANAMNRQMVLASSIESLQNIYQASGLSPTTQGVLNIAPRNVGLIRGFYAHITVSGTTVASQTLTRTTLGPANCLSLVTFNDLSNQQRINAQGWALPLIDTARRRRAANSAFTSDTVLGFGANFPVMLCPATVAASTAWSVDYWTYIPISYTDRDLRGAIYAGVVNAVMNLQLTLNNSGFFASSAQDPTLAVFTYTGAAPTITSWGCTVYQDFLDQLPFNNTGPVLPFQDISWSYLLNTTFFTAMSAGQDYPISFPNFRNIQSVILGYDNGGSLNAGSDINYLALQSANYTNIFKVDPLMQAILTRNIVQDDFPKGFYYFDFRKKPLSTVQYGNLNLVVNPSSVTNTLGTPQFLVAFEQLAQQNQIVGAGSIAGG